MTASMFPDLFAIDPNRGRAVNRSEVEQDAFPGERGGQTKQAAVPGGIVGSGFAKAVSLD